MTLYDWPISAIILAVVNQGTERSFQILAEFLDPEYHQLRITSRQEAPLGEKRPEDSQDVEQERLGLDLKE